MQQRKKVTKNAAAAEKIAKNQLIPLKENKLAPQESGLKHIFFFNASFIDFLNAFFQRRIILLQMHLFPVKPDDGMECKIPARRSLRP